MVNYWPLDNDVLDHAGSSDLTMAATGAAYSTDLPTLWLNNTKSV